MFGNRIRKDVPAAEYSVVVCEQILGRLSIRLLVRTHSYKSPETVRELLVTISNC